MSFLNPDPLPRRQKLFAITSIVLMIPVFLHSFHVIDLGAFRLAPFMLLLILIPFTWTKRNAPSDETAHG